MFPALHTFKHAHNNVCTDSCILTPGRLDVVEGWARGAGVPEVQTQQCFGSDFCQQQLQSPHHLPSNTQRFDSCPSCPCPWFWAKQFPLAKVQIIALVTEDLCSSTKLKEKRQSIHKELPKQFVLFFQMFGLTPSNLGLQELYNQLRCRSINYSRTLMV